MLRVHKQPCHVVGTHSRPTPLQHWLFPAGGGGLHLVLDEAQSRMPKVEAWCHHADPASLSPFWRDDASGALLTTQAGDFKAGNFEHAIAELDAAAASKVAHCPPLPCPMTLDGGT